jgi:hypothetical protein
MGEIQAIKAGLLAARRGTLRAGTFPAFTWGTAFALTFAALSIRAWPHGAKHFLAAQFAVAIFVQRLQGGGGCGDLLGGKLAIFIGIEGDQDGRHHHAAAWSGRATGAAGGRSRGSRRGGSLGLQENDRGHKSDRKKELFHGFAWGVWVGFREEISRNLASWHVIVNH